METFEKRDKETVTRHLEQLPHKEAIEAVVIDMSGGFRSAIQEALPGRAVVAEKSHDRRPGPPDAPRAEGGTGQL